MQERMTKQDADWQTDPASADKHEATIPTQAADELRQLTDALWTDHHRPSTRRPMSGLGYPTQKPLASSSASSPRPATKATWCSTRSAAAARPSHAGAEARPAVESASTSPTSPSSADREAACATPFPGVALTTHGAQQAPLQDARPRPARGRNNYCSSSRNGGAVADRRPAWRPLEEGAPTTASTATSGSAGPAAPFVFGQGRRRRQRRHDPRPGAASRRARGGRDRHLPHPRAPDPADARRKPPAPASSPRRASPRSPACRSSPSRTRCACATAPRTCRPARDDAFKHAAREETPDRQGKLDL